MSVFLKILFLKNFIRYKNILLYKHILEDGKIVLYVGTPSNLSNYSYDSILSACNVLFDDIRASYYIKQNYNSFDNGNIDFDGVFVETNITKLPVSDINTVLLPSNMVFAKITIDKSVVVSKLDTIEVPKSPSIGDETENSNISHFKFFIVFIILFIIIIAFIFLCKIHSKNNF